MTPHWTWWRLLDSVRISVRDDTHCSQSCVLLDEDKGICALQRLNNRWCLEYDQSMEAYRRCKKCLQLERKD